MNFPSIVDHGIGVGVDILKKLPTYKSNDIKVYQKSILVKYGSNYCRPCCISKTYSVFESGIDNLILIYNNSNLTTPLFTLSTTTYGRIIGTSSSYYGLFPALIIKDRYFWYITETGFIRVWDLQTQTQIFSEGLGNITYASLWYSTYDDVVYYTYSNALYKYSAGSSPSRLTTKSISFGSGMIGIIWENSSYLVVSEIHSGGGYLGSIKKSDLTLANTLATGYADHLPAITVDSGTFITSGFRNNTLGLRKYTINGSGILTLATVNSANSNFRLFRNNKNELFAFARGQNSVARINPTDLSFYKETKHYLYANDYWKPPICMNYDGGDWVAFTMTNYSDMPFYASSDIDTCVAVILNISGGV